MSQATDPFSGIAMFIHTAEARSFTGAARLLGLTPSAVSKAAARLEQDLGVRLFNRSPRAVTLTSAGEAFYRQCQGLVRAMEEARAATQGAAAEIRGRLRLAVSVSFGAFVIAPALPDWCARHPGVDLQLILTDRHVDLVEERFDLTVRLGAAPDSRLVEHRLAPHRFLTAAAPSYLAAHGPPRHPDDLAQHRCLGYTMAETGQSRVWQFEQAGQVIRIVPINAPSADSAPVLLTLAQAGVGIIQAPWYVLDRPIADGTLVPILSDYASFGLPLTVLYPRSRYTAPAVRAFTDFVKRLAG